MKKVKRLGGAVYILPNLITTGNIFFGFFSIIKGLQGQFLWAASAILLAAVFDVLDGRVARLTGGTSEFGVQYDSLCDLVSFGLAPAFLMYQTGLSEMGRIGWIACFLFLACGALRLARFNVQTSIGKASGDFTGLPIPMAAGFIASFVVAKLDILAMNSANWFWVMAKNWVSGEAHLYLLLVAGPFLGVLMVSNVNFRSHKSLRLSGINPFKILVIAVALVALVAIYPEVLGFLFFAGYALSGPLEFILGGKKAVEDDEIFDRGYEDAETEGS